MGELGRYTHEQFMACNDVNQLATMLMEAQNHGHNDNLAGTIVGGLLCAVCVPVGIAVALGSQIPAKQRAAARQAHYEEVRRRSQGL